jgi:ferritin
MIGNKMLALMNEQIKHELESAYLYRAMSAYFADQGWDGMAHWMKVQAGEEEEHADKFFHHIVEREGRVELFALAQPRKEWESPLTAWKAAYEHELFISASINGLVKLAGEENDYAAIPLLNWFVEEQVEEEKSPHDIMKQVEKIKDSVNGMYMLDSHLAKRE